MKNLIKIIRSKINNTFVADCPKCHKHFYGFHEYGKNVRIDGTHYRIVCHECHKKCDEGKKE